MILLDPPLDPDGAEGRSLLRRELADPDYYSDDLLQRIVTWVQRRFDGAFDRAQDAPAITTFLAILVAVALITAVMLLVSRARRTARAAEERRPVLTGESITAAALRDRAEAALAEGRYDDALVDAYRAVALRQIERDRIDDLPQATAHELAGTLGAAFPDQRHDIDRAADLFDAVLYGDHPATADQARAVLRLDLDLGAVRR